MIWLVISVKRVNELFDVKEDFKIISLHSDSRYVGRDSVFFCIEGLTTDGHRYADDAVFQGAKVIVHSKPLKRYYPGVLYIQVKDVLDELNRVANVFYDYPSYKMTVIGITGTSGKTVVALTIRDVLNHFLKTGYIGTNDAQYGSTVIQSSYTTPETIFLHRTLNEMVKSNVKGVTIEVSSHGLALKRVDTIDFDIAVFTNLHEEHLDFHGTMENLMRAKAKLFELVDEKGYVVLNADEVRFNHFLDSHAKVKAHRLYYGIDHKADVMARNVKLFIDHTEFDLFIKGEEFHVNVPILGRFNVSNILATLTSLLALEMSVDEVVASINLISQVDGRMELLNTHTSFHVIVDYCQYGHAFEETLSFAKSVVKGNSRIIAVVGVPMKNDNNTRSQLAKIADQYCDQVIFTESEKDRDDQLLDMAESMENMMTHAVAITITNRRVAIFQAIEMASNEDLILLLGKGHEQFMKSSVGNQPYPGDKYLALKAIDEIFNESKDDVDEY